MKVRDAMAKTISTVRPGDNIVQIARLMKQNDTGFIPVTESDRLVGVITDRDIVIRGLAEGPADVLNKTASHVMSSRNLLTVTPADDLEKAAKIMEREAVRRLAVVQEGRVVGVVSHGNLVQAMAGQGAAMEMTKGVTRGA